MIRRDFLSTAARGFGALATLPLIGTLASRACAAAGKPLGVALVGLGGYASKQLAPALLETKRCRLAGIVTGTKAKEAAWADQYGIAAKNIYNYGNFDSIAENPDIDIIYIVLPNAMHAEYIARAAKAGKHVICEKPMAITSAECRQAMDACAAANVKLSIGYRLHFDPNYREIMMAGREKRFGAVRYVNADMGFPIGDPTQWRLNKALAGGGAMYDVGVYCTQSVRCMTGEEPIAARAQEFKTDPVKFREVDETICFQLEFPSGAVANCTTSYKFRSNRVAVSYDDGLAELEPAHSYRGLKGYLKNYELPVNDINQQALQMDDFARCVSEGRESEVSGVEGLKDLLVLEAVYRSIEAGGARVAVEAV